MIEAVLGGATLSVTDTKKVTISMSEDLLVFADRMAETIGKTRSGFIASLLDEARARELERLAAEGYRFFSAEANEFAAASETAVAEAIDDEYR
jgi:metal-responsive CopG/Arc/MetJ family transcriptional regulator